MSIDGLPQEESRKFPDNVYTEPTWTRTEKGILRNSKKDLDNLYNIFEKYKKKGRVLAEGNKSGTPYIQLVSVGRFSLVCSKFSFYGGGGFSEQLPQISFKVVLLL